MNLSEEQSQMAVVQWFAMQFPAAAPWLHHSPNGGQRHKATAGRLKAMGARSGFPDLILCVPRGTYVGAAIEMKVGRNKATGNQLAWLQHLSDVGWYTAVCVGVDEAMKTLRLYMRQPE